MPTFSEAQAAKAALAQAVATPSELQTSTPTPLQKDQHQVDPPPRKGRDLAEKQYQAAVQQEREDKAYNLARAATKSEFDLVEDVATASGQEWVKSLMWLGPSRSGKSWAMASSLQEAKWFWESKGETVGVWWFSGKHDPDEHAYAHERGYRSVSEYQLDSLHEDELEDVFEEWCGLLDDFIHSNDFDKRFFVFDELNLAAFYCTPNSRIGFTPGPWASKFWRKLIGQAVACSSNGRGVGKACWLASQMSSLSGIGLSKDQCGVFHDHIVFLRPEDSDSQFAKGASRNDFISGLLNQQSTKAAGTGRYYHYQGRWRGLPTIVLPKTTAVAR
jgi:hypothetical protein